jgi:hypothetical protein
VLNKVLPSYLRRTATTGVAKRLVADPAAVAAGLPDLEAVGDPADVARVLTTIGESFLNYQVVAKREAEQRASLAQSPDVVAAVPYFESDIADLGGLSPWANRSGVDRYRSVASRRPNPLRHPRQDPRQGYREQERRRPPSDQRPLDG